MAIFQEKVLRRDAIALDLRLEGVEIGVLFLLADLVEELDAHVRAVQIGGEIEQMHLEHRAAARRDRRPHAETRHGRERSRADAVNPHRVDSGERGPVVLQLHVRGRETELAPELPAVDYAPADAVRAAEKPFGGDEIPARKRSADCGAGHAYPAERHDRQDLRFVAVSPAEVLEQRDIARALRAEAEILADQEPLRPERVREHPLGESLGSERREGAVKTLNVRALHAVRREELQFLSKRREAGGRGVRSEEFPRVGLEREHAALQAALARAGEQALQHRLVSAMDAFEISYRERDWAAR